MTDLIDRDGEAVAPLTADEIRHIREEYEYSKAVLKFREKWRKAVIGLGALIGALAVIGGAVEFVIRKAGF